jgi:hypothetical protein
MKLEDPIGISELIASTIGLAEDAVVLSDLAIDLHAAGTDMAVAKSVSTTLATVPAGTAVDLSDEGTGLTRF